MVRTFDCVIDRGSRTNSRMNRERKSERSGLVELDPGIDLRTMDTGRRGRLVLLLTEKKPRRHQGIARPQGGRQAANLLNTQQGHPLAMHAEWFKSQMNHAGEPGNRTWFLSAFRFVQREKVGGAEGSGGAVSPHPDRSSPDDNDESGGDNEAEESDHSALCRRPADLVCGR
jgi:hypothetical protein